MIETHEELPKHVKQKLTGAARIRFKQLIDWRSLECRFVLRPFLWRSGFKRRRTSIWNVQYLMLGPVSVEIAWRLE